MIFLCNAPQVFLYDYSNANYYVQNEKNLKKGETAHHKGNRFKRKYMLHKKKESLTKAPKE